jgi:hypothetical protein
VVKDSYTFLIFTQDDSHTFLFYDSQYIYPVKAARRKDVASHVTCARIFVGKDALRKDKIHVCS